MLKPLSGAFLGLALAAASSGWAATSLADFIGKSRVLVVSSPSATDPALERQNQWLKDGAAGLRDRDLVVIRIVANTVDAPQDLKLDSQTLRQAVGLKADTFGVALIGKDGSEAFRRSESITMQALFEAIDAMPMRQRETQQRKP